MFLFCFFCLTVSIINLVLIDKQSVGKRSLYLMGTVNAKKRWTTSYWRVYKCLEESHIVLRHAKERASFLKNNDIFFLLSSLLFYSISGNANSMVSIIYIERLLSIVVHFGGWFRVKSQGRPLITPLKGGRGVLVVIPSAAMIRSWASSLDTPLAVNRSIKGSLLVKKRHCWTQRQLYSIFYNTVTF
jgi:hypothetical protein